jgi:UDP-3-O-[3-hydroxymyristoyl] N-acetylglucosamine deacetylase/3-hydroxyacyl-[acyl-carrier-protein] dehydratase
MSVKQKTIKQEVRLKGIGLHTGKESELVFKAAPENHGYKFQRVDVEGKPIITAVADNVVDTSRGTTIEENGVSVSTIEHLLASVFGLGIDNILIEINAPEVPILDGSAKYIIDVLKEAGIEEQDADRVTYKLKNEVQYVNEEQDVELTLFPSDKLSYNVMVDYNTGFVTNQYATLESVEKFEEELGKCRTFVFFTELEYLFQNNLIKGGDLDNAIVILDKEVDQTELDRIATVFNKPKVSVKPDKGILNNIDLHFGNEPARHKLLDLMGDLALVGYRFSGKVYAHKPGHFSNVEFAKIIRQYIKKERLKNKAPEFNLNATPALNINQIKGLLPHRYPFLLVDKILEVGDSSVVGVKNVTANEGFFVGHFPEEPVFPGVLQIEAMAQVGGILVLNSVDNPKDYSTYFMKIDNVKFKRKVIPGDTIVFQLELKSPIRRGIANMFGKAFVGDNVVMEGELMAQIAKNK